MAATPQKKNDARCTLTFPAELNDEIAAKAEMFGVSFDVAAIRLLRRGIRAQNEVEAIIAAASENLLAAEGPEQINSTTDILGASIFGN